MEFRKAAIDKVSSPEQLDLLMQVTSPMGWLALATVGVLLAIFAVWSVVGAIPDLVEGQGVLLRGERLQEIKAPSAGTVRQIDVRPDTEVAAGQVILVINRDKAEIEEKIGLKQEQLNRLRAQHAGENTADEMNLARNQEMIAAKKNELGTLQRQRRVQEDLVRKGLKPGNAIFEFDRKVNQVQGEVNSMERENSMIKTRMAPRENEQKSVGGEIELLRGQLERTTQEIKSPVAGRVVEVLKSAADKVREGDPLVRIEAIRAAGADASREFCDGNIHAVLYVPGRLAGKVQAGHVARVSPSDVDKQESGYIVGRVQWVSSFAASPEDMREKLKNDATVQSLNSSGPVFETRICLALDPANKLNGFRWSSPPGPAKKVNSGTLTTASLVVDQKAPFTYVIPMVKRATGL